MRPTPSPSSLVKDEAAKSEVPGTPTSTASLNQVSSRRFTLLLACLLQTTGTAVAQ